MLRLARLEDLPAIKIMYLEVIEDMKKNKVEIWDEFYPTEVLENDINLNQLFVYDDNGIVSCFALCKEDEGDAYIKWPYDNNYIYLARFVVSLKHQKHGYGTMVMDELTKYCLDNNYQSIKALVVDYNISALSFYKRNGFELGNGVFHLVDNGVDYDEYGLQKLIVEH